MCYTDWVFDFSAQHREGSLCQTQAISLSSGRRARPSGSSRGTLAGIPTPRLGSVAIKAAVGRAGIEPAATDEVLMGCVVPAGLGQAPARQASIFAGMPDARRRDDSQQGMWLRPEDRHAGRSHDPRRRRRAVRGRRHGKHERLPLSVVLMPAFGYRLGDGALKDSLVVDGLWCAFEDHHMGNSAEWIAGAYGLRRDGAGRVRL